jgi:hypothetical protein
VLYRVFPFLPDAPSQELGGALYVPRQQQGEGRHDHPDHYGALYVSRVPEGAVAERIRAFRGRTLDDGDFRLRGISYALATLEETALDDLVELDDPTELARRELRPSLVATRDRRVTQEIALRIFQEGVRGFGWWSTLESAWPNVTLFAERASARLALVGSPELLTVRHPMVREAAEAIGVQLASSR